MKAAFVSMVYFSGLYEMQEGGWLEGDSNKMLIINSLNNYYRMCNHPHWGDFIHNLESFDKIIIFTGLPIYDILLIRLVKLMVDYNIDSHRLVVVTCSNDKGSEVVPIIREGGLPYTTILASEKNKLKPMLIDFFEEGLIIF